MHFSGFLISIDEPSLDQRTVEALVEDFNVGHLMRQRKRRSSTQDDGEDEDEVVTSRDQGPVLKTPNRILLL